MNETEIRVNAMAAEARQALVEALDRRMGLAAELAVAQARVKALEAELKELKTPAAPDNVTPIKEPVA